MEEKKTQKKLLEISSQLSCGPTPPPPPQKKVRDRVNLWWDFCEEVLCFFRATSFLVG